MNPLLLRTTLFTYSLKREFQFVLWTFIFILSLPLISVLIITNAGIPVISEKLASVTLQGQEVEIYDPTGKAVTRINLATTWPVKGVVTLNFGEPHFPYQPIHTGIDIANPQSQVGDPITPFLKGKVIYADEISWGYGKHVIIDHGNNITSLYGHLHTINVAKDQEVDPGDIIGTEGTTGWSTGPHLHFEIRVYGIPVNPKTFIIGSP